MTPEQAIAALLAWFESQLAGSFNTFGRRINFANQVPEQPALFVTHYSNQDVWSGGGLTHSSAELRLFIYAQTGVDDVPDTILNNLVAAIAAALAPDSVDTNEFTLDGLVTWVRISGRSEFYPGDIGTQAIAVIPVTMLLTGGTSRSFTIGISDVGGPDPIG